MGRIESVGISQFNPPGNGVTTTPLLRKPEELETLVRNLQRAQAFPHPVRDFEVIETHISFILLTGDYAYKFKKPIDLGFLNFTDPDKRRFYCDEELRLNRRFSPRLYLDTVAITGSLETPAIGADGPLLDYAVCMRQFDPRQRLDRVAARGELRPEHIDALADELAQFHQAVPATPTDSDYGEVTEIRRPVLENFHQIEPLLAQGAHQDQVERIRRWTESTLLQIRDDLQERRCEGWIRECHGDLHLENIALVEGKLQLFDSLEFNASLRWIDTMSEIAFLVMDLDRRGFRPLAIRFMNRYLEQTGDYLGLGVFRFYMVYRAMVRAKVVLIQSQQHQQHGQSHAALDQSFQAYLDLAERYTQPPASRPLIITHGLSGSGKSWLANRVAETVGALRIRSDVERKRMFKHDADTKVPSAVGQGMYQPDITRETYRRLHAVGYMILDAGCPAILDATFLDFQQRENMRRLAQTMGVPFIILDVQAPDALLRQRISQRQEEQRDASDANLAVLDHQIENRTPLADNELGFRVVVDTSAEVTPEQVVTAITDAARRQTPNAA